VIWDVSALSKWHVTGPDALVGMDRLTTRPTAKDRPGQVRYVLLLNHEGLLVEEGTRYVFGPRDVWLVGNEDRPAMATHIQGSVADLDVHVANRTDKVIGIAVQGPRSFDLLAPLVDVDLTGLGYYQAIERTMVAGAEAMVSRTGFSGELGYELFVVGGAEAAGAVWDAVTEAGARPMGLDAVEMLRVEAGLVVADEDYVTGATDPIDLSLEAFIDLEGDAGFIGREAVASRMASPARRLVTLSFEGGEVPPAHVVVTVEGGAVVGEVRSAQRTPRFGVIALAVIDTAHAAVGTRVMVGEERRPATARPRPIDDGDRARRARP
jgi:aminomethyltransferase